jgi:alkanesulfonate monooxygenase SsuD/methylene tetrahydromethanopterin reductase-like flavin-dependent oxidoreductase (luciferase family)
VPAPVPMLIPNGCRVTQRRSSYCRVTGEQLTYDSKHYQVDTARLYSLPRVPPPVYVSGFGEKSARLAARIARAYEEAGFDEVYLGQVGGRLEGAFEFFATQVLRRVRES